jgi:hypothetical protein
MNQATGSRVRWLRIGAESLAIVASILIAFGIDAWWSHQLDLRAEREVLVDLEEEFERIAPAVARRTEHHESQMQDLEWLLDLSPEEDDVAVERFDEALTSLVGAPLFDRATPIQEAIIASGRINVLSDDALRYSLVEWGRLSANATDNDLLIRDYLGGVVIPFFAAREIPIGRVFRTFRQDLWGLSAVADSVADERYRALVADPEFRVLATWRYDWALSSVLSFRRLEEAAEEILELLGQPEAP